MILCDSCNRGFHIHCLAPPLQTIPKEEWFCSACLDKRSTAQTSGAARVTSLEGTKATEINCPLRVDEILAVAKEVEQELVSAAKEKETLKRELASAANGATGIHETALHAKIARIEKKYTGWSYNSAFFHFLLKKCKKKIRSIPAIPEEQKNPSIHPSGKSDRAPDAKERPDGFAKDRMRDDMHYQLAQENKTAVQSQHVQINDVKESATTSTKAQGVAALSLPMTTPLRESQLSASKMPQASDRFEMDLGLENKSSPTTRMKDKSRQEAAGTEQQKKDKLVMTGSEQELFRIRQPLNVS